MLEITSPINETQTFNNFSMEEKTPIVKINLRGNPNNKDFTSRVVKTLEIILPIEVGSIAVKEEISIIATGPNEWLIISNNIIKKSNNDFELENVLFDSISQTNLGAVTNVSNQFTIFSLRGSNIFEVLSKSSPFDFDTLSNNYSVQTLLNNIDVTIIKKDNENVDLLVRRSFSEHLWDWIKDSANLS
jgi:sarcosine oxidase subunit gamma|tara:strand:- start:1811 stop:2374 length:564 start_codon:yes stop_codon:yes gene_type:complete